MQMLALDGTSWAWGTYRLRLWLFPWRGARRGGPPAAAPSHRADIRRLLCPGDAGYGKHEASVSRTAPATDVTEFERGS